MLEWIVQCAFILIMLGVPVLFIYLVLLATYRIGQQSVQRKTYSARFMSEEDHKKQKP